MAQEYRRTCGHCGKVWHSLVAREAEIEMVKQQAAFDTIGRTALCCCADNSQNVRNMDAGSDALTKLRQCPECGSSNYSEQLVGDK